MKANELRIGNKVSYEGSIVTVSTIADDEVTFSDYASFDYPQIEDISGIELTDEWLVRFGFTGRTAFKWKGKVGIQFSDNEYYIAFKDLSNVIFHLLVKIQLVHQLQNLYFYLTGQELAFV